MTLKSMAPIAIALTVLTACGGGGAPGKKDVQKAVEALTVEQPYLFGDDKPIINDTKCTKTGKDHFECVSSLSVSSAPTEIHPVTIMMTKLSGKWVAQIPNIMQ